MNEVDLLIRECKVAIGLFSLLLFARQDTEFVPLEDSEGRGHLPVAAALSRKRPSHLL